MSPTRRRRKRPDTPAEWQEAVDLADAMLVVHSARCYGLIAGGPKIDPDRCDDLLREARSRGFRPRPDEVDRIIAALAKGVCP